MVEVIAVTSTTVSSTDFIGLRRRSAGSPTWTGRRGEGVALGLGVGLGTGGGRTRTGTTGGATVRGWGAARGRPRGHSPSTTPPAQTPSGKTVTPGTVTSGLARRSARGIEIDTLGSGDLRVDTRGTFTVGPTVTRLGGAGLRTDTRGTGRGGRTRPTRGEGTGRAIGTRGTPARGIAARGIAARGIAARGATRSPTGARQGHGSGSAAAGPATAARARAAASRRGARLTPTFTSPR
ncbi:hypothetical protein FXF51_18900 [Nonomuraea sp. PA05]|uniref:hypothetical protein n=1 Tax=Nonomuraea sp. PA05 TaxID=2604466 RepID=UPI0011D6B175|nr:hypothetical protein [Nonomuraea sp. PA05]TYB65293.1 hypothetical protein FXF51_18900 [Nonomuraea sp. PA05]